MWPRGHVDTLSCPHAETLLVTRLSPITLALRMVELMGRAQECAPQRAMQLA